MKFSIRQLLFSKKLMPMLVSGSLSVINDNIMRQGVILLITYKIFSQSDANAYLWVSVMGALYFLPTFLFSVIAGELADKMSKARLFQLTKLAQIPICIFMSLILLQDSPNLYLLGLGLFFMATHDAIFSPVRYGILPETLHKDQLIAGNGLLEASTLISIATGIGLAGIITSANGQLYASALMISCAIGGYISSLWIKSKPAIDQEPIKIQLNLFKALQDNIDDIRQNETIWQSILGIAWFWFVGYNLILQFSNYVKFDLLCDTSVSLIFNLAYTIGIAAGSLSCHKLLENRLDSRLTPLALLGLGLFGIHMWAGTTTFGHSATELMSLQQFILYPQAWRLILDVTALSFCGGVLIVPLYAIIQRLSRAEKRSRNIAGINIVSSLAMVFGSILQTMIISSLHIPFIHYMGAIFVANLFLSIYAIRVVPFDIIRKVGSQILQKIFRIEITGLEHFEKADRKLLIIANHISYLDVPILAFLLPRHVMFAINTEIAKWTICRLVAPLTSTFPIDPSNPMSTKSLIEKVNSGRSCIIFPEGALSRTGKIMKIYEGTAMIASRTDADIIAINLGGVENNFFTPHTKTTMKMSWLPRIRMSVSKPFKLEKNERLTKREMRAHFTQQIYHQLTKQAYLNSTRGHLIEQLYEAKNKYGSNKVILEDITGKTLTYSNLITKTHVLGCTLNKYIPTPKSHIGLLLPNTLANVVAIFSVIQNAHVPAMLNYTAGINNLASACKTANIRTIITSKAFIEKANLGSVVEALNEKVDQILYLEDIAANISITEKLKGLFMAKSWSILQHKKLNPEAPALILFTSGSEGSPKGVVLSHDNVMANIRQIETVVDITPKDKMFNPLPMFHAFGINVGTLTPLFGGVFTYLYPNPKHFTQIPNIIYEKEMTIILGTNTFLSAYHRSAHPYDFNKVRIAVAGGEKLTSETRRAYANTYGIRVIEGYGSTECSPVISCNSPIYNKPGSVGTLLPGVESKLTPFPSRDNAFELHVKGDNVMLGYLLSHEPGKLVKPEDGWYATGDVVEIDDFGFISIVDRAKRFAKIGGEMISLSQVEDVIQSTWPEFDHGLVTVSDLKRGEKIILITTNPEADRKSLLSKFSENGLSNIALPSIIEFMKELPLLGSGKIDYVKLKSLVTALYEEDQTADIT